MTVATLPPAGLVEGDRLTLELMEELASSTGLTDSQKRTLAAQSESLIERTVAEPGRLWDVWSRLCELAFAAGAEVLHARRDQLAASLAFKEELVQRGLVLAGRVEPLIGRPLRGADQLPAAAQHLREFRETVLDRWKTLDDLAEMLIEKINLSPKQQKALAAAYPPPQSWYDDDFDPFPPDAPE